MNVVQVQLSNSFADLQEGVHFEPICAGRTAAIIVNFEMGNADRGVPIVRSTTVYKNPPTKFNKAHLALATAVSGDTPCVFNNAMVEKYTSEYRRMRFHSDLALDLSPASHIAIFSCYNSPQTVRRKLVVKPKDNTTNGCEIVLEHNTAVLFSLATNAACLHKIVPCTPTPENMDGGVWLGVTLRLSKTFVQPSLAECWLHVASSEERAYFMMLRSKENKCTQFEYPHLPFTLSASDLMVPQ